MWITVGDGGSSGGGMQSIYVISCAERINCATYWEIFNLFTVANKLHFSYTQFPSEKKIETVECIPHAVSSLLFMNWKVKGFQNRALSG